MKLLVTGGAGFIGSNFIRYWLREHPGDTIVNFDKLTYAGNLDNLVDLKDNPHYTFVRADICEIKQVIKTLQLHNIDTIIHFAASTHVDRSVMLREKGTLNLELGELFTDSLNYDFILNNVWGTHILLESAVQVWKNEQGSFEGKRFHHVSTDEVFGALKLEDTRKFNEKTLYDPRSPYSASKAGADHLVRSYYATFGLPITISNTSNNFGPYQYPEKLLPVAILNVMQGKKVPIYGDGKYIRDWLYVDDHARAIDLILSKGKIGQTYCIGGLTEDVDNLALINKVLSIMGKGNEMVEFIKDRPGHDRRYAVDWSKAKKEIGYRPLHDLDTYLKKTIAWYQNNEWWWKKILQKKEHREYLKKQYGT
ncbi:MAG: dTDP-glucose 4,6-dehydratase [Patescibacteria group bacterium]